MAETLGGSQALARPAGQRRRGDGGDGVLILLTHANHLFADRKQVRKMQPYPPLHALIAAAHLRNHGFQVAFADTTFDRDIRPTLDGVRPDLVAVCEDSFNFLTKMCLLQNRELAFEIAELCACRGIPAVIYSSDATDHVQEYLAAGFSQVILGDLEPALLAIGRSGPEPAPVAEPVRDLDHLPFPAWDLVDIERYRNAWIKAHGYFSLNLVSSRGCPYRCNWCAKPLFGDSYRHYSPARIAAEIECVHKRFQPDSLWFGDDIFGLSANWTREFAACVERGGNRVPFRIQSRCNLMTAETTDALWRAGCSEVWMGVESGSQRILEAMEKGVRVEQVREARENLRRQGIRACYFLQLGYRGEEWEDLEETIRLVRETKPDDVGISVSYPLPNTRFHQIVQAELSSKTNWKESGDLDMMFHGAFPTEFYRAVADAIHAEVRWANGSESGGALGEAWDKVEQLRCACC
jgi:anaerobic magnesium-protoporphyrin IX monomethyl ester cyclase